MPRKSFELFTTLGVGRMLFTLVELSEVRSSGRLDFDFFHPAQEAEITLASGYTRARLGDLCLKVGTGKTAPRGEYPEIGVRILKVKNVRGSGIDWATKFFVSETFYKSAQKKAQLEEGDILMLCAAHNKAYIGRSDIVGKFPQEVRDDNGRCIAVGELIIIRADPSLVVPEYLITYLRLGGVQEQIRKIVKGQTAHLYPRDLVNLEVVLPPREIQEEIAEMHAEAERDFKARIKRAQDDLATTRELVKRIILTGTGEEALDDAGGSQERDEDE